jgi:alkylhydroperoxidase/carboxymuconolactone decarboxylase family protein YurZ
MSSAHMAELREALVQGLTKGDIRRLIDSLAPHAQADTDTGASKSLADALARQFESLRGPQQRRPRMRTR